MNISFYQYKGTSHLTGILWRGALRQCLNRFLNYSLTLEMEIHGASVSKNGKFHELFV